MAISGKFEADFSSYVDEVHKSTQASKEFEAANKNVEASVNNIAAAGDKLALPTTNLRIVKGAAQEAGTAAHAASEGVAAIGAAAEGAAPGVGALGHAIGETGHILDLFDIKVGEASVLRKGLVGLGEAMESDVGGFGLLGEAAAVAGTGLAAFEVTKKVLEVTGLGDAIGRLEDKLLGLPDAAKIAADGAAQAIEDARKKYPDIPIGSLDDVVALRQAEADATIAANKAKLDPAAVKAVDEAINKVNADMQKIRDNGVEQDLIRQINSHKVSLTELATAYNISIEAMQQFSTEASKQAAIEASNTKKLDDLALQLQHAAEDRRAKAADAEDARLKAEGAQIDADTKAAQARQNALYTELVAQQKTFDATKAETQALNDQAAAAEAVARATSVTYDLSTAAGIAYFKSMNPGVDVNAGPDYFKTHSLADAVAAGLIRGGAYQSGAAGAGGFGGRTTVTGGGSGSSASSAPTAPAIPASPSAPARPPTVPAPPAAGVGARPMPPPVVVHAPVYVSGVFDPASAHAIGGVVGAAIAQTVTSARVLT